MKKFSTLSFLAIVFCLISVWACNKEARAIECDISLGEEVTLSGNNYLYFTPEETGGYALKISADAGIDYNLDVRYYMASTEDSGWMNYYTAGSDFPSGGGVHEINIPFIGGRKYRLELSVPDDYEVACTLTRNDAKSGIYNNMMYIVKTDSEDTHEYIEIVKYMGEEKSVRIPGVINGYPVEVIGDYAFGSDMIESVYVEENVKSFGNCPFGSCYNLKYIELPSTLCNLYPQSQFSIQCTELDIQFPNGSECLSYENGALIYEDEFWGGTYLVNCYPPTGVTEYTIPEGVTNIPNGAFPYNTTITKLTFPSTMQRIGYNSCPMETLTDVYMKNGSTYFDKEAFYDNPETGDYKVTVHAPSDGYVENLCKEYGITFEANGEQTQKEFVVTEGVETPAYRYGDDKFYWSFVPGKTDTYIVKHTYGMPITIFDESGNEITLKDSPIDYTYLCDFEEGKTYSIIGEVTQYTSPVVATITASVYEEQPAPDPTPTPTVEPTQTPAPTVEPTPTPEAVTKPAQVKSVTVKNVKTKKAQVSWKKVTGAKGYQIQYATTKKFTKKSAKLLKKTKVTIKGLKKKKTYYFRVRAYKLDGTKKVYGKWSAVKKVKIKK